MRFAVRALMRNSGAFHGIAAVLLALAGTACGVSGGEESTEQGDNPLWTGIQIQPSADEQQVDKAAVATTTYQWNTFPDDMPIQEKLCVVSGLYGGFAGYYDRFELLTWASYPNYDLRQNDLGLGTSSGRGSITCTRYTNFLHDAGGVRWLGTGWGATEWGGGSPKMWWGDAASFLMGIQGEYAGGGEVAKVIQSTGATTPSVLDIVGEAFDNNGAHGNSYFVGIPGSGKLVRLYGYRDGSWVRGSVKSSATFEFNVSTTSGFSSYWLPPRDRAFCYLTRVGGEFDGGGERLQITVEGDNWFLRAQAAAGKHVAGAVRCMAYDQRG
jgi:hypothetical protein